MSTNVTKRELIAFELQVAQLWETGELPYLLHLSGGNEDQLLGLFEHIRAQDWVFSTHRNHYHALLKGIPAAQLISVIKRGDSMFVFDKERNFFSSAILAGTCAIAVGVSHALRETAEDAGVWCFVGDGAEEEGHFYEAVMFVAEHDLPCTFVIEDNHRTVHERKTEFRMKWPTCVMRYTYTPTYPHAGNGTTKHIEFKR